VIRHEKIFGTVVAAFEVRVLTPAF